MVRASFYTRRPREAFGISGWMEEGAFIEARSAISPVSKGPFQALLVLFVQRNRGCFTRLRPHRAPGNQEVVDNYTALCSSTKRGLPCKHSPDPLSVPRSGRADISCRCAVGFPLQDWPDNLVQTGTFAEDLREGDMNMAENGDL